MENIVIKLGGSVITYKDKPLTPRLDDINRISREISEFFNDFKLVIVHGGGSFGHFIAKKYNIHMGLPRIKLGLSILEKEMRKLNLIILESLINHGVPVFPVSPSNVFILENGKIKIFNREIIDEILSNKYIPLLYGDVVFDYEKGCVIFSGDQISLELCKIIGARKLIFCIDVTGIYDKDPKKFSDAKLIKKINHNEIPELLKNISKGEDVTGGIYNKLSVAYEGAKLGIKVIFINGLSHNLLKKVIYNQEFVGTEII